MIRLIVGVGELLAFLVIIGACVWGVIAIIWGVEKLRHIRQSVVARITRRRKMHE